MKVASVFLGLLAIICVEADVGYGPGEQKWGYVDVREGAHMFWWLYYTTAEVEHYTDRPLLIWLQGGPGASSTGFGNFGELGPLDAYLHPRNYTWVNDANVLFIDNPVGSGFSYVDEVSLLAKTNAQIAADLVKLLRGFLEELPEFKSVPLYITSESYGGKMTIEFAYEVEKAVAQKTLDVQLIGVELGDSWISPVDSVMTWAPYLYHVGALDKEGYEAVKESAESTAEAVAAGQWIEATTYWGYTEGIVNRQTYGVDFYNILTPISGRSIDYSTKIFKPSVRDEVDDRIQAIMNGPVKRALNIDVRWGAQSNAVFSFLNADFMKPVVDIVEKVLNETDIIVSVVSGQLDLIVDTPGTEKWVEEMSWIGKSEWDQAKRTAFAKNGIYEGYVKSAQNLRFYWVNRAGHMVPSDNPAAMDVILRQMTGDYSGTVTKTKFHP